MPLLSIIVPTYNEAFNMPLLAVMLARHVGPACGQEYEVLVVDDTSPDGTAAVVQRLACQMPQLRLRLLQRPGKLGLGSAYREGLSEARGELVLLMDADLSHHPK